MDCTAYICIYLYITFAPLYTDGIAQFLGANYYARWMDEYHRLILASVELLPAFCPHQARVML